MRVFVSTVSEIKVYIYIHQFKILETVMYSKQLYNSIQTREIQFNWCDHIITTCEKKMEQITSDKRNTDGGDATQWKLRLRCDLYNGLNRSLHVSIFNYFIFYTLLLLYVVC